MHATKAMIFGRIRDLGRGVELQNERLLASSSFFFSKGARPCVCVGFKGEPGGKPPYIGLFVFFFVGGVVPKPEHRIDMDLGLTKHPRAETKLPGSLLWTRLAKDPTLAPINSPDSRNSWTQAGFFSRKVELDLPFYLSPSLTKFHLKILAKRSLPPGQGAKWRRTCCGTLASSAGPPKGPSARGPSSCRFWWPSARPARRRGEARSRAGMSSWLDLPSFTGLGPNQTGSDLDLSVAARVTGFDP